MPRTPFLCHFVDSVSDKPNRDHSADFRGFLAKKLKLIPEHRHLDKCVLILSTTLDREADIVCIELLRRGIDYVRLNAEDIPYNLKVVYSLDPDSDTNFQINLDSLKINLYNISAVWLRDFDHGLIHSNSKDLNAAYIFQQWSDALQILFNAIDYGWINGIDATYRTNNRLEQLNCAKLAGLDIPSTLITNDPEEARSFYYAHNRDIVVKALHHHDIDVNNRIYSIYSHVVTTKDLSLFKDLIYAPSILQERVHNCSELRVTVVKDKVFSVQLDSEISTTICDDIHRLALSKLQKKPVQLEKEMELRCIRLIESLGLDYGAIDFVRDKDGRLFFLEVNPTGSWLWIEHETQLPITRAVVDLIENTVNGSP